MIAEGRISLEEHGITSLASISRPNYEDYQRGPDFESKLAAAQVSAAQVSAALVSAVATPPLPSV